MSELLHGLQSPAGSACATSVTIRPTVLLFTPLKLYQSFFWSFDEKSLFAPWGLCTRCSLCLEPLHHQTNVWHRLGLNSSHQPLSRASPDTPLTKAAPFSQVTVSSHCLIFFTALINQYLKLSNFFADYTKPLQSMDSACLVLHCMPGSVYGI